MSEKALNLNRDKLAEKQYEILYPRLKEKEPWDSMVPENHIKIYSYKCADAIIASLPDLLDVE